MTSSKDLKRLARARMRKTGESYTTARAHLIRRKAAAPPAPARGPAATGYSATAGMGDAAVQAKTGHPWDEWVRLLDAAGAASWPHKRIAEFVHEKHGVPGWWTQTVTVGYERIRGIRATGQRRDGSYEASKSRTMPVGVAKLYRAWSDARRRQDWLTGTGFKVRKATTDKSVRLDWPDGTKVEIYFWPKGDAKSQIVVQHRALASRTDADTMRAYWTERLDALAGLVR